MPTKSAVLLILSLFLRDEWLSLAPISVLLHFLLFGPSRGIQIEFYAEILNGFEVQKLIAAFLL